VENDKPLRGCWAALLEQRCPRCREGKLFETATRMHKACPACRLVWEREPGYFLGAMYVSYPIAIVFLSLFMLGFHLLLPHWDLYWVGLLAIAAFVPFVPLVFRYSRTIWVYFDRWAWPQDEP
jgi:uncharacterized protein (DUF983 family)